MKRRSDEEYIDIKKNTYGRTEGSVAEATRAVYSSTVLFWLGDESDEAIDTWNFLDRRIKNVMEIEKAKAKIKKTSFGQSVFNLLNLFQKPSDDHKSDFPGYNG